jgi:hypothetical protein
VEGCLGSLTTLTRLTGPDPADGVHKGVEGETPAGAAARPSLPLAGVLPAEPDPAICHHVTAK